MLQSERHVNSRIAGMVQLDKVIARSLAVPFQIMAMVYCFIDSANKLKQYKKTSCASEGGRRPRLLDFENFMIKRLFS